jgi:hypothetical protein
MHAPRFTGMKRTPFLKKKKTMRSATTISTDISEEEIAAYFVLLARSRKFKTAAPMMKEVARMFPEVSAIRIRRGGHIAALCMARQHDPQPFVKWCVKLRSFHLTHVVYNWF